MLKSILAATGAALLLAACESQTQALTAPPPPPPVQATSYMVFFDWDRSDLSQQALATIQQAADAYRAGGNPRLTAIGHTDTSGPDGYNIALSQRRANAVKGALVQDGVPPGAIETVGMGKQGLLVPTADGVREPQNRRVEITGFQSQVSQVGVGVFRDAHSYCKALSDAYRQYRGVTVSTQGSAALYRCDEGDTAQAIPALENELISDKIPLPSPGYRWPGQPISPADHV